MTITRLPGYVQITSRRWSITITAPATRPVHERERAALSALQPDHRRLAPAGCIGHTLDGAVGIPDGRALHLHPVP